MSAETSRDPGLHFATAWGLFDSFPTLAGDMRSRPGTESSLDFFVSLSRSTIPEEAITFGSHLLPRRKAVWWGHECLRSVAQVLSDHDLYMLKLAESWVREPEEEQRLRALAEGMACRTKTPGVWIALGAGWSGGSMVDADVPRIQPPAYLTPRAVNAGILSGLARVDNQHRAAALKHFVDLGVGLANR